ncbi:2-oxoglutarate-dependent dioxygenase DAO-like isoform X2 [Apium graveolens]|uniref:2-oxoglutarate-dependent dioxygenase DAO-like isoform X2 n=1 Tax=Apium graveolens TaxID=4045 RepID=UPI003D7BD632
MAIKCSIPVIDLEDFPAQSSKLVQAGEEWGCFRLVNHHNILSVTLMSDMKSVVQSLQDFPPEIKCRNTGIIHGSWETINKYTKAVHELLVEISGKLADALGISGFTIEGWPCLFRINQFNFAKETIGSSGFKIHTDSGFLAIVQDDEGVSGLEVMDKSGAFIPIDPWPGALVVNLGDVAKAWSNGRLRTVKHRVQCKEGSSRYSIAAFLGPSNQIVEAPPELVDDAHPRLYAPFTFEDYRNLRFSTKLNDGEALNLLLIDP